jgi:thiol-disulfide isomerase/thioredoxin
MRRPVIVLLITAITMGVVVPPILSQDKPAATAGAQAAERSAAAIAKDLEASGNDLRNVLGGPETFLDPVKRHEVAPKAIPLLKKANALFDELAKAEPSEKEAAEQAKLDFQSILVVLGEEQTRTDLEKQATSQNPTAATAAQTTLLLANWWKSHKDADAQAKVLDEVQKLAKAQPESNQVAVVLMKMADVGATDEKLAERARDMIVQDLKGDAAKNFAMRIQAERKLKEIVGKPIEISGTKLDGSHFSTKDWKGKVILVDFWATWCGPCVAALPRLKKTYDEFHAKGFEIVGVSCDTKPEALKSFFERNTEIAWPQLFDADQNPKIEWHPLAKDLGVVYLPVMFLIDKKGVLRTAEAHEDFEELIPKMIEEKAE